MALIGQLLAEDHWPSTPGPAEVPACSSDFLLLGPSPRSMGAGTSRSRARSRSMSSRVRTARRGLPGLAAASLPLEPVGLPLVLLLLCSGAAPDVADSPEVVPPPLPPPHPAIKAPTEMAMRVRRNEEEEEEEGERCGRICDQVRFVRNECFVVISA